jgi:hypothetical protein
MDESIRPYIKNVLLQLTLSEYQNLPTLVGKSLPHKMTKKSVILFKEYRKPNVV